MHIHYTTGCLKCIVFTCVHLISYAKTRIVCDQSYRVDKPLYARTSQVRMYCSITRQKLTLYFIFKLYIISTYPDIINIRTLILYIISKYPASCRFYHSSPIRRSNQMLACAQTNKIPHLRLETTCFTKL